MIDSNEPLVPVLDRADRMLQFAESKNIAVMLAGSAFLAAAITNANIFSHAPFQFVFLIFALIAIIINVFSFVPSSKVDKLNLKNSLLFFNSKEEFTIILENGNTNLQPQDYLDQLLVVNVIRAKKELLFKMSVSLWGVSLVVFCLAVVCGY